MNRQTTVFYAPLQQYSPCLINRLPEKEKLRVAQFTSTRRKQLFILGRALLADALFALTGNKHFELRYQKHGKPEFSPNNDWQFNLTHSGEHLFLALRPNHPIGIDSEILLAREYSRLAKKLFTAEEQNSIANAEDPMQTFYRFWTCYEAQIKYLGLSVFSELPETPKRYLITYRYQSLLFSLCSDSPFEKIDCYRYTPSQEMTFENIIVKQIS